MTAPENFARVDGALFRGGRPTPEQAQWLVSSAGVKSVINLELFEEDRAAFAPFPQLQYRHLPDWEPVAAFDPAREDRHLKAFLAAVSDMPKPVYVHCRDGQNRTGLAVAAYRLVVMREPLDAVLADLQSYKGLWEGADTAYLRSLATRVAELAA